MDDATRLSRCARCGAGLPLTATGDLCPACEHEVASAPTISPSDANAGDETRIIATDDTRIASVSGNDLTVLSSRSASGRRRVAPKLVPGQMFGAYRIGRLLGRGGMGDVYEAEHVEHGRRVAIKVLNSALAGEDDLARFLSEGQQAASITHPHTVYIFGSEEIDGAPVITMELLSGGTLRDLVQANGPLPPAQAVDMILQVVAGLEAAARAGVLHRDVKPANCFVDLNGAVKVGDFGLSISTHARQEQTGMFLGTPQYAAPEQIRGEELDVRADIYAVGGTLFYLLTGQPPFDDRDLTTLVTRVTTEPPRSPREMRAGVPPALAEIVTRCLSKGREQRPATYAALEDLLRPFSSAATVPASLRRRFLAGVLDQALFMLLFLPVTMYYMFSGGSVTAQWWMAILQLPYWLTYFSVLEWRWGASVGKMVLGMQLVTATESQRPGFARALGRAAVYQTPAMLTTVPLAMYGTLFSTDSAALTRDPMLAAGVSVVYYVLLALLFVTARRRNGNAALQDRLSGTRVIRRRARAAVAAVDLPTDPAVTPLARATHAGPYNVIASLGSTDAGELRPGFDLQLKRRVWLHVLPPGTAPIAPRLRDLGRVARLRWLSGRRAESEAWDAYEAFDGLPLARIPKPQRWGAVRRWLLDLATEVDAGLKDGSLGALTLDRVWITRNGHAKLLDFRAPGVPADPVGAPADLPSAQRWLAAVATRGLAGASSTPTGAAALPPTLAMSGRALIDMLQAGTFASPADITTQVAAVQPMPDVVEPWRRAASVWLPLLAPLAGLAFGVLIAIGLRTIAQTTPDMDAFREALKHLNEVSQRKDPESDLERRQIETYIAGTFRATMTNPTLWTSPLTAGQLTPYRPHIDRVLAAHPSVSPEELAAARASLGKFMDVQKKDLEGQQRRAGIASQVVGVIMTGVSLALTAAFGLAFALAFRGGLLLRIFGLAVVDGRGRRATRARAFIRAVVTWTPAVAMLVLVIRYPVLMKDAVYATVHLSSFAIIAAPAIVFAAGAIVATLRPTRGWQDRIAGTWIVPR